MHANAQYLPATHQLLLQANAQCGDVCEIPFNGSLHTQQYHPQEPIDSMHARRGATDDDATLAVKHVLDTYKQNIDEHDSSRSKHNDDHREE